MNSQILPAVLIVVALLVILGVLVKVLDLKRKREAEAVHVQAQISDALLREPALFGMPVTPTAHVPLWSGTPVKVEVTGQIPAPEARDVVLRLVRAEAVRVRPDVDIEDRLTVDPGVARVA
ncbi:MAG: hypothetical protein ACREM3_29180 [Candidatus Rokuibacteriota bacterium]